MTRFVLALVVATLALPLEAQVASRLQQGVRVKVVTNDGAAIVGRVAAPINDTLLLSRPHEMTSLAVSEISSIRMSRGKGRAKGALIKGAAGLGIGLLSGAILGATTYEDSSECQPNSFCLFDCIIVCSRSDAAIMAATLVGGLGLVVGTIAGIATGWEQWEAVPIPRASTR